VIPDEVRKESLKPGREPKAAKNAKKDPLKIHYGISPAYMATTHPGMLEKYMKDFGGVTYGEQRVGLHLMATHGFLENSDFNRAFWTYSDIRFGFDGNQFNRDARNGELLVTTPERTYLVRGRSERPQVQAFKPGTQGYWLAAMPNTGPTTGEYALVNLSKRAKPMEVPPIWSHQLPLRIRSMVLAGETLFVAGVPDVADPTDPFVALEALEGRKGAQLQAYSAADGRKLAEYQLKAPPVFDGLIAAAGRLYWSTTDGKVMCMAGQPQQEQKNESQHPSSRKPKKLQPTIQKKKAASPVKPAPVAKPAPGVKHEVRRWAVGKHQENTGSFVRTFVNPKQKKLVTLRSADGKEFNISHRSLTPEDLAYLESIQAETKQ
jgi:hypothetical protein